MIQKKKVLLVIVALMSLFSCHKEDKSHQWERDSKNPVFSDLIVEENYKIASDPHVFYDQNGFLKMIYTGQFEGHQSIMLAEGSDFSNWTKKRVLLAGIGPSGLDLNKETCFYRLANNGKHQLFYVGYNDEEDFESQIYLAESDQLEGPYTTINSPIVSRGNIAGKSVYCMTSPSIVEHQGVLYLVFIGWDAKPKKVKTVWMLGAKSLDDGYTWTDFQEVTTPIGMEGQLTKALDGSFVAVSTGKLGRNEAIYYATATHPFGPYTTREWPIIVQEGRPLEKDEIIAPQITFDQTNGVQHLFYTGSNHRKGWWIMHATEK